MPPRIMAAVWQSSVIRDMGIVPTENVIGFIWPKNQQHPGPRRIKENNEVVMKTPHVTLLHAAWGNL